MLGRGGPESGSSPNKSTFCAEFCGARDTREGGAGPDPDPDARCDADRSIFTLSWTTLSGYHN